MLLKPLPRKPDGFSLTELLMALLILSVISTYTIPKVLMSQANAKKRSVFREAIAAISEITYLGTVQNDIPLATAGTYFMTRLNCVKQCPANAQTEGCFVAMAGTTEDSEPGCVLQSGAAITGMKVNLTAAGPRDVMAIDWNGSELPNTLGDDIVGIIAVWGTTGNSSVRPGTVGASDYAVAGLTSAANQSLYEWIFQ